MASIHTQPGKPNWFAAFTGPDSQRHFRSTGTPEKSLAKRVAAEFERAAKEAKAGRFNESIVRSQRGLTSEDRVCGVLSSRCLCSWKH
jgi:hypothetical protein